MRKFFVAALAASMLVTLASMAFASHVRGIEFRAYDSISETWVLVSEVDEGELVRVIATTSGASQNMRIEWCLPVTWEFDEDEGEWVSDFTSTDQPLPMADCAAFDREDSDLDAEELPAGDWATLVQQNASSLTYEFDTATYGAEDGRQIGFRARHGESNAFSDDLTVNREPSPGEDGEHPGCKGVQNAIQQVEEKNKSQGQGKTKALEALEAVQDKLDC